MSKSVRIWISKFLGNLVIPLEFEEEYLSFMKSMHSKLLEEIKKAKKIEEKVEKELRKATEDFKKKF